MPKMDYSALRKRMKASGFTIETLAKACGMSKGQLCLKLNNKLGFTQTNICAICRALNIDAGDIGVYFFCVECCER